LQADVQFSLATVRGKKGNAFVESKSCIAERIGGFFLQITMLFRLAENTQLKELQLFSAIRRK
jgi:hypothetical protein